MDRKSVFLLIGLLLLIAVAVLSRASMSVAAEPHQQEEQPLRLVTKPIEPFVIKDGDRLTGFNIDLWKEIALITEMPFEFVEVGTVADQLEAVANGEADVAIAAISMTPERETQVDFSYPYFRSGLQIMTKSQQNEYLIPLLAIILSPRFLAATAGDGTLIVVGTPFQRDAYAIALPPNSPHEEQINKALLELKTSGLGDEILKRWSISEDGK